jgi:prenylcysteine oxidase/farnesylcysteine lyase
VIHGLETMVCLAPQGAVSVIGGNWKIFSAMANSATKEIHTNTAIQQITRRDDGTFSLKSKGETLPDAIFDEVIVAGPFQYMDLSVEPALESLPEPIPYVTLHVTLFASPRLLSPGFFKLPTTSKVPLVVLTTLTPDEYDTGSKKPTEAGTPGFFSISMLRPTTNPFTQQREYLYKIFSPQPVEPGFLADILGVSDRPDSLNSFSKSDVSWLYEKVWHSYPVEWPRVTFERILLADGLWYTGGMESFISTMETNALSGMNVAKLIVEKWASKSSSTQQIPFGHKSGHSLAAPKVGRKGFSGGN